MSQLPELPERFAKWTDTDGDCGAWAKPDCDVFTADQMHAFYAQATASVKREPLSEEALGEVIANHAEENDYFDLRKYARAIEQAHGIDGAQNDQDASVNRAGSANMVALYSRQWLPIETAPKDGTEILLYRGPDIYEGKPVDVRVTSGAWIEWEETAAEYHSTTGEYLGQSLQDCGANWSSWDGGFREEAPPTHWMPLPQPLVTGSEGDGNADQA